MSVSIHKLLHGESAVEISASVEQAIRAGGLSPGSSLPTVRGLAEKLGVSPATVAAAYKALKGRGLIDAHGRRGTRVSARPPIHSSFSYSMRSGFFEEGAWPRLPRTSLYAVIMTQMEVNESKRKQGM